MAKQKLSLTLTPTFTATVGIPVAGASKPIDVEFTFKARAKDAFQEFMDKLKGRDDVDILMDIVSAWGIEEPFGRDTVEQLTQTHMGAAFAIVSKYIAEQTGAARLGN